MTIYSRKDVKRLFRKYEHTEKSVIFGYILLLPKNDDSDIACLAGFPTVTVMAVAMDFHHASHC